MGSHLLTGTPLQNPKPCLQNACQLACVAFIRPAHAPPAHAVASRLDTPSHALRARPPQAPEQPWTALSEGPPIEGPQYGGFASEWPREGIRLMLGGIFQLIVVRIASLARRTTASL